MQQWLEKIGQVDWAEAVLIFILGICTVFAVLILLWAILSLMKFVFYKENTVSAEDIVKPVNTQKAPAPAVATEKKMSTPKTVATAPPSDEDELVALLNGAVAAYANTTTLRVKSYKKI